MKQTSWPLRITGLLAVLGLLLGAPAAGRAQGDSHTFPETGHTVSGLFWQYWQSHGGLSQQGYPLSEPMQEKSDLNGQTYTVQYFERAVFEQHPENQPPFNVLLSQLGTFRYKAKYPGGAPNQHTNSTNPRFFPETNHTVGGVFRAYWESHGGLAQQGYPLSDEFTEVSDLNHQSYTVQYFERAVFELHPENQPPYNVLLSQLGKFQYQAKYQSGTGGGTGGATPTPPPAPNNGHQNKDANVSPLCGVAGTTFQYSAVNFTPHEGLSFWFTAPNGGVVGTSSPQFTVGEQGAFTWPIRTTAEFASLPGWWAMTWQGASSGHQSIGWFYIARNAGECANITGGGQAPPPTAPPSSGGHQNKDAVVNPVCGVAGSTFQYSAVNFTPHEGLSFWFTAPDGETVGTSSPQFTVGEQGAFTWPIRTTAQFASLPGWWAMTWQGASSGHQSIGWFYIARNAEECANVHP